MEQILKYGVLGAYILCCLVLIFYAYHYYLITFIFLKKHRKKRDENSRLVEQFNENRSDAEYPMVTLQLPIYNEAEVAVRLIKSAITLDYPRDRFEIQVLDDSTDETKALIDEAAEEIKAKGFDISVVRRDTRQDYKAGALKHAMPFAKGEYLAMFDSDFIIQPDFLKRSVALIHPFENVACVQGRWEHLNRNENWLTRVQATALDAHFATEQGARYYSDLCLNFNGTGGIWRASAIEEAGGWQGDTLTEDQDLSYRVQMNGRKMVYDFDLKCPAELPNNVVALKSQQRRWAKGSMETAIKLLPQIIRCKNLNVSQKIEAFMHLTHYIGAPIMVLLSILTLPMLHYLKQIDPPAGLLIFWVVAMIGAFAPGFMYGCSGYIVHGKFSSFRSFPSMVALGTGLCINNTIAVLEAWRGQKSEFVRTPKSGSTAGKSQKGRYKAISGKRLAVMEIILGLYCLYTFCGQYLSLSRNCLYGFFIGAYAFGLIVFGMTTLKYIIQAKKLQV